MDWTEAFRRLGIEATKEEKAIKNAYREKLSVTNPEDNPEGFKLLRAAYEEACRYAKEEEGENSGAQTPSDTTPSGLWVQKAAEIYANINTRQDEELWKELFEDDIFLSLEEEENCRVKLLRFLMEHFKLPTHIWKLLDKKLSIVSDAKNLREKFPAHFMRYMIGKCERGEDVDFAQFQGPEGGDYDLFLQYYDRCWQALQEKHLEEAEQCLKSADDLGIRHPAMEICRALLAVEQGKFPEAEALMEDLCEKYPKDDTVRYHAAEFFWEHWEHIDRAKGDGRERAAGIYLELKADKDSHYMANIRLTEWYYLQKQYREAKKCAEKVLAAGGDDAFMELLGRVNAEIEKDLEAKYRKAKDWESALELCWCYLQDGRISRGVRLAQEIEKILPPEKETEYNGLLAKLFVEYVEYEEAIVKSKSWEELLKKRIADSETREKRDEDRLRQAHLIRMQCYHNLGYREKEKFALAIKEGESLLTGGMKDIGLLLEMAQVYTEMEEYEQSLEITDRLVEEYQVFAAYATALETYRRQLNARGVVWAASQCIRFFPSFVKAYEYLAKVYLDLNYREELEKVLEDAEKKGVKSVILDAYRFQMTHETMEISFLNQELKKFRAEFHRRVEEGEKGWYEKGLPILTEFIYHYPDDFMLVERAIFHRAAHHYTEAKEDFEKALHINPSNPYALNGLSFVYKYLGDYEKALHYIKKAILYIDNEMSPIIYADMGNVQALLGDYERALAAYRQYERLAGTSRSSWFGDNLAEFALRAGRVEEAEAVYERFYGKDQWTRYEKLVKLYLGAGKWEKARQTLRQWGRQQRVGALEGMWKAVRGMGKAEKISYHGYYNSKGWVELLTGSKGAAARAFEKMAESGLRAKLNGIKDNIGGLKDKSNGRKYRFNGLNAKSNGRNDGLEDRAGGMESRSNGSKDKADGLEDKAMGERLCDGVFACILCGDEKRGRKLARRLQDWLEKKGGRGSYYNREKKYLQIEFLTAYYTEPTEKLKEILDREEKCEICHECSNSICEEMEGVRILFLLRMGRKEEAKERLLRSLEAQPWDEYLQAIKHMAFQG